MIVKNNRTFHIQGKNISYIIIVNEAGDLLHYHFGKKLSNIDYTKYGNSREAAILCCDDNNVFLETSMQEYPAYGYTDLRSPAYIVKNRFNNSISRLVYKDYVIKENEVAYIEGMPTIFQGKNTAQTLEITLCDDMIGLEVVLSYTVFDEYDIILRNSRMNNKSNEKMIIESAYSASIDFEKRDLDLIYFPGAWCREREFVRSNIKLGAKIDVSNARGGSGHAMNPFVMICDRNSTEKHGEVYGFSLIYSGNHSSVIESDQYGNIRVKQGINPFSFEKKLMPDETFYTPQSLLCYSDNGFGGLSREIHNVYRNNLCRSKWANKDRPVLLNNWEGTYFDFNEQKLINMAQKAKVVGTEIFVLDDGWFGKRNDDKSSLGDWFVNKEKLPSGINGLAEKINAEGLGFGLWIEPEMVSPDSQLYNEHPEWIISVPNIKPALGRNQFMLDLSNDDVCNYIINSISNLLSSANIVYVKWDYNRVMTDMPYKGYNHQYILGLYKVLDALTSKFPNVLFEGCASGGGRFDPGILAYFPQIWTSDNSDAISRLKIQYSTSICYPISSMSAHVSPSPNHQVGRLTSLQTRAEVAYVGIFGYELDITNMSDEEIDTVKKQVDFYKKIRTLIRTGDFYRLQSPYESNYCSWEIASKDKKQILVFGCRVLSLANDIDERIRLEGLEVDKNYIESFTGEVVSGSQLMYKGFEPAYSNEDFSTFIKLFENL